MTEAEWLACTEIEKMLESLRGRATERKLRLFACACGRRVEHLAYHGVSAESSNCARDDDRRAIEVAEQVADGLRARDELLATSRRLSTNTVGRIVTLSAAKVAAADVTRFPRYLAVPSPVAKSVRKLQKRLGQAELFRDIFGNPFRKVKFSPAWRTDTAVAVTRQMYESRDFSAMPILTDALQDAGCDSGDILAHCRGPGPHVRGYWVCDLVLGKS